MRTRWLQIRLTEEEHALLVKKCGGKMSEYVRSILFGRFK
jgi:hypothetical protein